MIVRARGANVELRSEWGNADRVPGPYSGWLSSAGVSVTPRDAFGLPAVSNVIRAPAEIIASLPFLVYQQGDIRERAETSWQWRLLHDQPNDECDTFEFFYDLALSIEATQNAFVQKAKYGGKVLAAYVLDPQRVTVRRDKDTGQKLFDVYVGDGKVRRDLTTDDILHVRGFSPAPGAAAGVSLLEQHRDPVGAAIAMQRFEGDYFRNHGQPPFWFTGATSREHAQGLIDAHNSVHQGAGRQWKAGALWGDVDVKHLPLSLEDAVFADAKRLSIEDACRIWRWPKELLELSSGQQTPEEWWDDRFLKFYLLPRLKRIERAFAADPDLFPKSTRAANLFGEFLTSSLERASFATRIRGYKDARQGSWITANEIRRMENLPPVDGGDEILITPTGSAPNPDNARSLNGHRREDRELVAALLEE